MIAARRYALLGVRVVAAGLVIFGLTDAIYASTRLLAATYGSGASMNWTASFASMQAVRGASVAAGGVVLALLSLRLSRWLVPLPRPHACPHCDYDRKGLPPEKPCPECGYEQPTPQD